MMVRSAIKIVGAHLWWKAQSTQLTQDSHLWGQKLWPVLSLPVGTHPKFLSTGAKAQQADPRARRRSREGGWGCGVGAAGTCPRRALWAAPGSWLGWGQHVLAEGNRKGKKPSSIAASLLGIPAQLTDMQISLIISSSKINYILQWLQYVVSGKITFNIFKLIDVSLEKTWLTAARKLGCYLNAFLN